ncbi:MAG: TAXI family TRAP transporter solute-binding subunit, partial [Dehalobacterium sp.]
MISRKNYICWLVLFLMMSMAILAGCGSQEEQNPSSSGEANNGETQQEEPKKYGGIEQISVGSSSVGSSSYSKIATWSDYISTQLGINITPEGTAGSDANAQLTDVNEVQIGSTMVNIAREGYEGIGFSEGKKLSNLRLMVTMDAFALQFYAKEKSGIKSFEDLAGKHINLSKAGSGTDTWTRRAFEDLNVKIGKISNVSPTEGNDLMRDGVIDASGCMGSIHPSIIEMASTEKVNIFGTGDRTDEFLAKWPDLNKVTMRENTYEGQTEPFV